MIQNCRSDPAVSRIVIKTTKEVSKHEGFPGTYVEEVITLTEEHPEILSGIFDINELKAYLIYSQDYQDITKQLENLLDKLKQHHEKTNFLTVQLASSIQEHLDLVAPGMNDQGTPHMMSVIHKKETGKISPGTNDFKIVS